MISSGDKKEVFLDFMEVDMGLLDEAKKLETRRFRPFTREEDYIIYTYWNVKMKKGLCKLLNRYRESIHNRFEELSNPNAKNYIAEITKEFKK